MEEILHPQVPSYTRWWIAWAMRRAWQHGKKTWALNTRTSSRITTRSKLVSAKTWADWAAHLPRSSQTLKRVNWLWPSMIVSLFMILRLKPKSSATPSRSQSMPSSSTKRWLSLWIKWPLVCQWISTTILGMWVVRWPVGESSYHQHLEESTIKWTRILSRRSQIKWSRSTILSSDTIQEKTRIRTRQASKMWSEAMSFRTSRNRSKITLWLSIRPGPQLTHRVSILQSSRNRPPTSRYSTNQL